MDVENFINHQLGILRWTHSDSILSRLRSLQSEEYKYILPDDVDSTPADSPIFACKFAEKSGYEHLLALANEEGKVAIYDSTEKNTRFGKNVHHNAVFDLAWQPGCTRLVTASGDNTAALLEMGDGRMEISRLFYGHTRSVKSVAFMGENDPNVFSTGSRDGTIILWDMRANNTSTHNGLSTLISSPDRMIMNSHSRVHAQNQRRAPSTAARGVSGSDSVTCVTFADANALVSCGAGDGAIKIWDMRKTYRSCDRYPVPKHILPYYGNKVQSGFTNLLVDSEGLRLYASCLDNVIYCYNLAALNASIQEEDAVVQYVGHENATFYVKSALSPCGRYLISGSSDQNAYIWNVADCAREPIVRLRGHMAEVTCVAWLDNKRTGQPMTVVTCSDDMRHRVWRLRGEEEEEVGGFERGESKNNGFADRLKQHDPKLKTRKRLKITFKTTLLNHGLHKRAKVDKNSVEKRSADTELKNENKRFFSDRGPRRLFGILENNDTKHMDSLAMILKDADNMKSPPRQKRKRKCSETELETSAHYDPAPFSPTTNLPNFAVDGVAPHINYSPQKHRDADWLTKLRTEKRLVIKINAQANDTNEPQGIAMQHAHPNDTGSATTPKAPKLDSLARRTRRRSSCNSPKSPLYRYFRVTNNGQLSPKAQNQSSQVKTTSENTT